MKETAEQTTLTPEQQKELEYRLNEAAKDGRVPCASAQAIAKSLKLSYGVVGKTADKLKLRISKCQLGCF